MTINRCAWGFLSLLFNGIVKYLQKADYSIARSAIHLMHGRVLVLAHSRNWQMGPLFVWLPKDFWKWLKPFIYLFICFLNSQSNTDAEAFKGNLKLNQRRLAVWFTECSFGSKANFLQTMNRGSDWMSGIWVNFPAFFFCLNLLVRFIVCPAFFCKCLCSCSWSDVTSLAEELVATMHSPTQLQWSMQPK